MNTSGVYGIGVNTYAYTNNSRKTTETGNFADEVKKAAESQGTQTKSNSSAWAGDMVVPQPPNYLGFTYDSSISNKSKEEMTMDEYKQWFMNEMSRMPVSAWVRSTIVGGTLTITEECFERMKNDPEWENTVLNMVRKMYSVNGIMGTKAIGFQVIGASPEQCYGYAGPVGGSGSNISGDGKSWWEKRHEKMEELLEEIAEAATEKEALKKAQARKALAQENYLKSQFESQQRLHSFLMESAKNGQDTSDMSAIQSVSAGALAATAYEDTISIFSKSVMESQKI
ncbi:MAG: hypothetical protein HDQ97_19125 [Lachnospiraceae bacterium]|nr:hypothetical protein [Lachnospiraceae bacterium]